MRGAICFQSPHACRPCCRFPPPRKTLLTRQSRDASDANKRGNPLGLETATTGGGLRNSSDLTEERKLEVPSELDRCGGSSGSNSDVWAMMKGFSFNPFDYIEREKKKSKKRKKRYKFSQNLCRIRQNWFLIWQDFDNSWSSSWSCYSLFNKSIDEFKL